MRQEAAWVCQVRPSTPDVRTYDDDADYDAD